MATTQATIAASFKTILFATDFSSSSEAALPYLLSLARCFDSTVIAVHAVPMGGTAPSPASGSSGTAWTAITVESKQWARLNR